MKIRMLTMLLLVTVTTRGQWNGLPKGPDLTYVSNRTELIKIRGKTLLNVVQSSEGNRIITVSPRKGTFTMLRLSDGARSTLSIVGPHMTVHWRDIDSISFQCLDSLQRKIKVVMEEFRVPREGYGARLTVTFPDITAWIWMNVKNKRKVNR